MAGKATSEPTPEPTQETILTPIGITTTQADTVLELYSAYFNRAADAEGFAF